jgi:hypothetical protein
LENNIKMDHHRMDMRIWTGLISLAIWYSGRLYKHNKESSINWRTLLDQMSDCQFLKEESAA